MNAPLPAPAAAAAALAPVEGAAEAAGGAAQLIVAAIENAPVAVGAAGAGGAGAGAPAMARSWGALLLAAPGAIAGATGLDRVGNWIAWSLRNPGAAATMIADKVMKPIPYDTDVDTPLTYADAPLVTKIKGSNVDVGLKRSADERSVAGRAAHMAAREVLRRFLRYRVAYAAPPPSGGAEGYLKTLSDMLVCALIDYNEKENAKYAAMGELAKESSIYPELSGAVTDSQNYAYNVGVAGMRIPSPIAIRKVEIMPWQLRDLLKAFVQSLSEEERSMFDVQPGVREQAMVPSLKPEEADAIAEFKTRCISTPVKLAAIEYLNNAVLREAVASGGISGAGAGAAIPKPPSVRRLLNRVATGSGAGSGAAVAAAPKPPSRGVVGADSGAGSSAAGVGSKRGRTANSQANSQGGKKSRPAAAATEAVAPADADAARAAAVISLMDLKGQEGGYRKTRRNRKKSRKNKRKNHKNKTRSNKRKTRSKKQW